MQLEQKGIVEQAELLKHQLIDWRRQLHRFPELSFQEKKTSDFILEILQSLGVFDIQTGIAGHGIAAKIGTGQGPVIGIRADMDALPIEEKTDAAFSSEHPGIMHACGHDAHTAMLLGVAHILKEEYTEGRLKGQIKLLFQPAEEDTDEQGLTGAPYFLREGVIDGIDFAISLHVCPWLNTGEIQLNPGPSMASIDNFSLTIKGSGSHGGYPHQGTDPVWMSSFVLQGIYGLISRRLNPLEVGTISIGKIQGGSACNVIPDQVQISGTIRAYTEEQRKKLIKELEDVAKLSETLGGAYQLYVERGEPALYNDEGVVESFCETASMLYPGMNIVKGPYGMGGEDFSHILKKVPGAMLFLGCGWPDRPDYHLHTSEFQLNEEALPIGVSLLVGCAHLLIEST